METTVNKISNIDPPGKWKEVIYSVVVCFLAIIFLYAALSKIWSAEKFNEFKISLSQFPLIGSYSGILVYLIPIVEIVVGFAIIAKPTRKMGMISYFLLVLIFTTYIIYMESLGGHLPCPCGGFIKYLTWKQHIGFNLLLLFIIQLGMGLKSNVALGRKNH